MAITWGSWEGSGNSDIRVGIDIVVTSTSGNWLEYQVRWYLEARYAINDSMTFRVSGDTSTTSFNVQLVAGSSGGVQHVFTRTFTATRQFGGGPTNTFVGEVTAGHYGGGTPSHSRSYTIPARPAEAPNAPGNPTFSEVQDDRVRVSWTAPSNNGSSLNDYQVQWSTNSNMSGASSYTHGGWQSARVVAGLSKYTLYYFRVRARNSVGWGPWSNIRSQRTLGTIPSAAGTPSASGISHNSVTLTWGNPSDSGGHSLLQTQVQIARNTGFSTGVTTRTQSASDRNHTFTGLLRAQQYYARARFQNAEGWGPWSSTRPFSTNAQVPTMGTSYYAGNITRNSFTVLGSSVSDNGGEAPSNLRVQYNTSQSATGASVYTRGSWAQATITGRAANTTYYFRVAAYNSAGWSDYGPWKPVTTLDDAPDDMDAPTFDAVGDTGFTIEWTAPNMNGATFTAYRYEVSRLDTFTTLTRSGTTDGLSATVTGLTPGTRYYVRVRANASPSNGGWGEASVLTTGITPNSGLRTYMVIDGVVRQGTLYGVLGGQVRQLLPMYAHDGQMETD